MEDFKLRLGFFLLFGVVALHTQQGKPIGQVVAIEGTAQVAGRPLQENSPIYVSDILSVAPDSKMEVHFSDGGDLILIESTEYRVDAYDLREGEKSTYLANLLKGGFRAVSGSIGKLSDDDYRVQTPDAVIGIRGTIFVANVVNSETLFGVESGVIFVSNSAGTVALSAGQYVTAASPTQLGAITTVQPEALQGEVFSSPKGTLEVQTPTRLGGQESPTLDEGPDAEGGDEESAGPEAGGDGGAPGVEEEVGPPPEPGGGEAPGSEFEEQLLHK